jgi:hypothetical protein
MESEHQVPIWFFIGALLLLYGLIIFGVGVYHFAVPPPLEARVALYELHADIWWSALMIVLGAFYCLKFYPGRRES